MNLDAIKEGEVWVVDGELRLKEPKNDLLWYVTESSGYRQPHLYDHRLDVDELGCIDWECFRQLAERFPKAKPFYEAALKAEGIEPNCLLYNHLVNLPPPSPEPASPDWQVRKVSDLMVRVPNHRWDVYVPMSADGAEGIIATCPNPVIADWICKRSRVEPPSPDPVTTLKAIGCNYTLREAVEMAAKAFEDRPDQTETDMLFATILRTVLEEKIIHKQ